MSEKYIKQLGVNVDHVATLRQARGVSYPDPLYAALIAEEAGADLITIHLREDRRHILDQDVVDIKNRIKTRLNLEIATEQEMLAIACDVKPAQVCLVPEKRQELTTEGGLDVVNNKEQIRDAVQQLQESGIRVSLFIDPDFKQIEMSKLVSANDIEIHTGAYAEAELNSNAQLVELDKINNSVEMALGTGLRVNAGHGLHYHNVQKIAAIKGIEELNIGHSIISRAVISGLYESVSTMKKLILG